MANKKELEKLVAKYDKQYTDNYAAYQETGITRYSTAYHKAEDMADALRLALNAAEDHDRLVCMRAAVADWRARAQALKGTGNVADMDALLGDIAAMARIWGC